MKYYCRPKQTVKIWKKVVVRNHRIPPFIYLCQWTIYVPGSTQDKRTKITRIKSKHKVRQLTESNTGHVSRTYLFGQVFLRFSTGIMWNPSDQSNEGGIILEQLVSPMFPTIPCTRTCKVNRIHPETYGWCICQSHWHIKALFALHTNLTTNLIQIRTKTNTKRTTAAVEPWLQYFRKDVKEVF